MLAHNYSAKRDIGTSKQGYYTLLTHWIFFTAVLVSNASQDKNGCDHVGFFANIVAPKSKNSVYASLDIVQETA